MYSVLSLELETLTNLTMLALSALKKHFCKIRNPRKNFIVGDFNLNSTSWPRSEDMDNGNCTDKLLLTLFMGLGLINVFQDLPTIKVELLT